MPTLLERVAIARKARAKSETQFRDAILAAREYHTWEEIADAAGLSYSGVRYLAGMFGEVREVKQA